MEHEAKKDFIVMALHKAAQTCYQGEPSCTVRTPSKQGIGLKVEDVYEWVGVCMSKFHGVLDIQGPRGVTASLQLRSFGGVKQRASFTLQKQSISTNSVRFGYQQNLLTAGDIGFQLRHAGASWRVDSESPRGT